MKGKVVSSVCCAQDAPCFSVRTCAGAHTHVQSLVPAPEQAAPSPVAQHGAGWCSWSGLSERTDEQISCHCFSASGSCLYFSLFIAVGTTFPSPWVLFLCRFFIHSVVGYRQLSGELENLCRLYPIAEGKNELPESWFWDIKSKVNANNKRLFIPTELWRGWFLCPPEMVCVIPFFLGCSGR